MNTKIIILKSITWRILILTVTYIISMICGLKTKQAIMITIIFNVVNMVLYFLHEKVWNKIQGDIK